jgi:hypothetical protein|tara:strand:- start:83 stop:415 length:333 start_codon:yes stop_codon:yes gene_type:complete
MTLHIQFEDGAQEYLQKQFDIMQSIPADSGIEAPPGVSASENLSVTGVSQALGGINSSSEPGTLPVKMYFEQLSGGRGSDGVLKFEIDGIGTFSIRIPSESTAAIPTFQS